MDRFGRRRRGLRQITLLVAIAAACGAQLGGMGRARAGESGAFTFAWYAPKECPSQEQVEADIARLVGGQPRPHDGSDLQAQVTVSRGQLWSAELTTKHAGQTGHRSIEAPSCQAAAAAIAMIIALSIDPDAVSTGGQPAAASAPIGRQAPVRPERQLRFLAGVHGQGRVGTLPGTDVGVGLGIGLAGARWRAELRWTYGLRRDQVAALPSGAGGRFNVGTGSLTGCIDVGRLTLAFGPCAITEVGRASATGYGTTAGFSKDVPWLAVGGGVFSSMAVSRRLRASLELDALAPLYRPDYVFQDMPGVVFKAPPVGGRALVDLSWQF